MRMAETLREDPAILRDVALFHTVSFGGAGKAERTQEGREILDTMLRDAMDVLERMQRSWCGEVTR